MRVVCDSLSHFLTTYCLQEIAFGAKNLLCVDSEVDNPSQLVTAQIEDVWINGWYVYGLPTHSFYLCDGLLFIMNTDGEYWLAYNNDDAQSLISLNAQTRVIH